MNDSVSSYGNQNDNTRIESEYNGNQSDSTSILSIDSRTISSDTIASFSKTTDTTITRAMYSHRTRSREKFLLIEEDHLRDTEVDHLRHTEADHLRDTEADNHKDTVL